MGIAVGTVPGKTTDLLIIFEPCFQSIGITTFKGIKNPMGFPVYQYGAIGTTFLVRKIINANEIVDSFGRS